MRAAVITKSTFVIAGRGLVGGILCLWLGAASLSAQTPHRLETVNRYVGKTVIVHDPAGRRSSGRLIDATPAELTLSVDGTRRVIPSADIAAVGLVGDPIWDGALKAIGVAGLLAVLGSGESPSSESVASSALGVALFGGLGAWIDARRTRERIVYEKP